MSRPSTSATTARIQAEITHLEAQCTNLNKDLEQIQERIDQRDGVGPGNGETILEESGNRKLPQESQRDFLIRTGKITPFSKLPGRDLTRSDSTLQGVLLEAEDGEPEENLDHDEVHAAELMSHRNLLRPGFTDFEETGNITETSDFVERPSKRRRLQKKNVINAVPDASDQSLLTREAKNQSEASSDNEEDFGYTPDLNDSENATFGVSEGDSGDGVVDDDFSLDTTPLNSTSRRKKGKIFEKKSDIEDLAGLDDGNEQLFQRRLQSWVQRRSAARKGQNARTVSVAHENEILQQKPSAPNEFETEEGDSRTHEQAVDEWHLPHPNTPDTEFEGGYLIPGDIFPSLFDYQKTGVQWLWELYSQQVGGIIGDEMGLGKTIQIIAFLAGLHYSKKITRPIIVVTPATVMKQWVNEFHTWWPPMRVSILHTSGSGMMDIGREVQREDELLLQTPNHPQRKNMTKGQKAAKRIVDRVISEGHILVTTYSGLQTYSELLIPVDWEYAVLDEGHKIRNPNTAITIYCKELRTANRIILSGTPMQNNLVELWSLFDFVFPMRLGTLVNFRQQFEFPIRQGGYANASNLQVQTAMKCAETLKDTISPYLLQRFKVDVASDLPKKSEQVLFCKLTKVQRHAYEYFLDSDDMKAILNSKRQVLYGVDILRKICNHPDLREHRELSVKAGYTYGMGTKSGKMQVVKALLELWKDQGHKTLLFAQHRIMLDILEKYIKSLDGFSFRRMDGNTPIYKRQDLVDEFNKDPDIHVFLLTTKVGGLGVNLTGADRVIIYDPDWNPSTDIQARERAWRLGQKREVMIYRLMTAGTIEEKIYHRQLFKQFLTNKILRDPKQRQTFQMKDLHDLFSLGGADEHATETSELFKGTEVKFGNGNSLSPPLDRDPTLPGDASSIPNIAENNNSTIRNIVGVASVERFYGEEEDERKAISKDAANSEARVMEGIFARSGVHSALEHDQIINGKRIIMADPKIIEREAKKVAAEAAQELKKAGDMARTVPVGTPTWTGQYGTAGRPDAQMPQRGFGRGAGRGGPRSLSILAGLQSRQAANEITNGLGSNAQASRGLRQASPGPKGTDFMRLIRDYLVTHGGRVHTQMLIDHFNRYCNTPGKTAEFKAMLKEMATLERGSRGRGRWILKDEYR